MREAAFFVGKPRHILTISAGKIFHGQNQSVKIFGKVIQVNFFKRFKRKPKEEVKENLNENVEDKDKKDDKDDKDAAKDVEEEVKRTPKDKAFAVLRTIRNGVLGLILLTALVIGGFAAAVKYDVLGAEDVAMLNEELGLYRLPFVGNGRYFEVPEGVEWPPPPPPPLEPEPEPEPEPPKPEPEPAPVAEPEPPKPAAEEKPKPKREEKPKEVKIDRKAIEEQRAKREAEEKKRVTRLARIYESMKPEEAANALINVDWDTTVLILQRMSEDSVAQVLAKMEPETAAQLTEMLYRGTQRRVTTPSDSLRNEPVTPPEQILTSD